MSELRKGGEVGMTKQEILDKFSDIDFAYNDSSKNETLSRMLDELLKEQEAVEPTLIREGRNKNYNDYVCPCCDNEVVYEQNYCSECGVRFLWEGR